MQSMSRYVLGLVTLLLVFSGLSAEKTVMGTYVGELHERWQFPSDHLPIGLAVDDLNIVSWNVLDADTMHWVIDNSQGLSGSLIQDLHVVANENGLTIRDQYVIGVIEKMINHPTHPKHLLALQECSRPFVKELAKRLGSRWTVIAHHGEALVVDQTRIEVLKASGISYVFSQSPRRSLQEVVIRYKGQKYRLYNAHLPGDPTMPARYEFAKLLADDFDPKVTTIAMGDMNFNECEMSEALAEAFEPIDESFTLYTPYCTNISPGQFFSKAIDHFIVFGRKSSEKFVVNKPEEVLIGLSEVLKLLQD